MSEEINSNTKNFFLYLLLGCIFIAIASSFYFFYIKKDYDFFVETKCNPETETCFFRDCEGSPDICPPNNLSYYNQYTIKARDFKSCLNEDCTDVCNNKTIDCIKTECTEGDINEGICLTPLVSNEIEEDNLILEN